MADFIYPPCFDIPDPCRCTGVDFTDSGNAVVVANTKKHVAQLFYSATHGKYSCCKSIIHPCPPKPTCETDSNIEWLVHDYVTIPFLDLETDILRNCMPCSCVKDICECETFPYVELPSGVTEVTGVWIGGVDVYNPSLFWLNGNRLYTSMPNGFPKCNSLQPGSPDNWWVEFRRGYKPPEVVLDILSRIVCERVKYCLGLPCSALPITSRIVSGNGADFVVDDTQIIWDNGLTGYHELDNWIIADRGGLGRAVFWPKSFRSKRRKGWLDA